MFVTMKTRLAWTLKGCALLFLCAGAFAATSLAQNADDTYDLSEDIQIHKLFDGVYIHTSWQEHPGWGRVRSNGLIFSSGGEVFLVDTAWNDAQTEQILGWIRETLGSVPRRAVVTHGHNDRMGGIGALGRAGVTTYALPLTAEKAAPQGWRLPDSLLAAEQRFTIGDQCVEVFFPGPGHTDDNLVVWLPKDRVLFGGCLVKDASATTLGNTAEANLPEWPAAIRRLIDRYRDAVLVVPSHGPVGDRNLLNHTLHLLEAQDAKTEGG